MNSYFNYIIESGISFGIFTLIYILALRKETFFRVNRFYLVISSLFSAVLPLITINIIMNEAQGSSPGEWNQTVPVVLESVRVGGNNLSGVIERILLSLNYAGVIYLAGVLIMTLRFGWRFGQLWMLVRSSEKRSLFGIKIIRLGFNTSPFSFFRWLFVGKEFKFESSESAKILRHEFIHIRQGHSIDVLLFEILTILQWFNPFIWFLRMSVRENHEFIVDSEITGRGISIPDYKFVLLNQATGIQLSFTNNFNYSMLKSRFKMMTCVRSSRYSLLKYLLGIVSMIFMVVVFACETQKQDMEIEGLSAESVAFKIGEAGHGDKNSLLIVDGEVYSKEEAGKINPDSIASVSVYKGEKAMELFAEKYGEKTVKEGVVVIKTKAAQAKIIKPSLNGEEVFFIVEDMPVFPGGETALKKYIAQSIKYPEESLNKGIEGKVFISFVVDKNGNVRNAKVVRGADPLLDEEALRVINSLPRWKPAMQKGERVNVAYTVPINFTLQ